LIKQVISKELNLVSYQIILLIILVRN